MDERRGRRTRQWRCSACVHMGDIAPFRGLTTANACVGIEGIGGKGDLLFDQHLLIGSLL